MRTKTLFRLVGCGMLAVGLPSLYTAQFGVLWQPGYVEYLGWLQLYVLRPGLYVLGAAATVLGLWHAWIRWTTFGRVLRSWREACEWERYMDEQCGHYYADEPQYQPRAWRDDLSHLWFLLTHCAIGRHDPHALSYSDGGEDGPRGTTCADCGMYLSRENIVPERSVKVSDLICDIDDNLAPVLPDPLRHLEPVEGNVLVLFPDGQRRAEGTPDVMIVGNCRACNRPIGEHEPGEYDNRCPYFAA